MAVPMTPERPTPQTPTPPLEHSGQAALFEVPPASEEAEEEKRVEYELLTGHERTDKTWKTGEQLRSEYVELTDELVRQMTEGIQVTDPRTGERTQKVPDVVVWLDKSARPVSWLTAELWPLLAPGSDGKVPPIPKFYFANIDREQWVNTLDPMGTGSMDIDRVDKSLIRSLRSIFVEPKDKQDGITKEIDEAPAVLDGKTILIVDEVRSSGRTLDIASKFFKRAFPTSAIATTHWMKGMATFSSGRGSYATGNADLPVWYREDLAVGRGVGNRDERISRLSDSLTQRLGAWFLSTALRVPLSEEERLAALPKERPDMIPDPLAIQLRRELHQLAKDARDKLVLVVPSSERDGEDAIERARRLNAMSLADYQKAKLQLADS